MRKLKEKEIYESTSNRSVYNKVRKRILEQNSEIHCSMCGYHRGENGDNHFYGGYVNKIFKYPSWKLVSKNRKQWMVKPIKQKKFKINSFYNEYYIKITF